MNANQTQTQIPTPRRGGAPDETSPIIQSILNKVEEMLEKEFGGRVIKSDGYPWNGWILSDGQERFESGVYWRYLNRKRYLLNEIVGRLLDELINVNNEIKEINEEWEKVMR